MPRDDRDDGDEDDRPKRGRAERDGLSGGVVVLMLGVGLVAVLAVGSLLTVIVFWVAIPAPKTPRPGPVAVAAPEPIPVIVPFDDPPPDPVSPPVPIAEPRPDVMPPEPAPDTPVVLRNVRRTAGNDLVIDYESVAGVIDPDLDVLVVKGSRQRVVVAFDPSRDRRAGTITLTPHVNPADAPGTVRVFVERKPRPGFYTGGTIVSNTVTVN